MKRKVPVATTAGVAPLLRRHAAAIAAAVALVVLVIALAGCGASITGSPDQVSGSGNLITKTYDVSGFSKVTASSVSQVSIKQGDTYAVSVTADDNLVAEYLDVKREGETLHIGMDPTRQYRDVTLRATVTMPRLTGVEATGASAVDVNGFAAGGPLDLAVSGASRLGMAGERAGVLTIEVSGAGRLEGDIEAQNLAGDFSGGSVTDLRGSVQTLQLQASGGSRLELAGLAVQDAELSLSGGSSGIVDVTGTLNVEANGGAHLEYRGSPLLHSDTSAGASVGPAGL